MKTNYCWFLLVLSITWASQANAEPNRRIVYFSTGGYISECWITLMSMSWFQKVSVQMQFNNVSLNSVGQPTATSTTALQDSGTFVIGSESGWKDRAKTFVTRDISGAAVSPQFRTLVGQIVVEDNTQDGQHSGWVSASGNCKRDVDSSANAGGSVSGPDGTAAGVYNFTINGGRAF